MSNQRLYRSVSDRMIAGVCAGLGKFFSVDPSLVRLVFLLLFFLGGSGLVLYVILWIIVPDEQRLNADSQATVQANVQELGQAAKQFGQDAGQALGASSGDLAQSAVRNGPLIFAVILIGLGVLFLLQNLLHINLSELWPVILILIGLVLLVSAARRT